MGVHTEAETNSAQEKAVSLSVVDWLIEPSGNTLAPVLPCRATGSIVLTSVGLRTPLHSFIIKDHSFIYWYLLY